MKISQHVAVGVMFGLVFCPPKPYRWIAVLAVGVYVAIVEIIRRIRANRLASAMWNAEFMPVKDEYDRPSNAVLGGFLDEERAYLRGTFAAIIGLEVERTSGRWIAEVDDLPGVLVYEQTREDAIIKVKALALRVLAEQIEHGERESPTAVKFEVKK